jgi:HK97 gp10 family phage protein
MSIKFIDHTEKVKGLIEELAMSSLEEAAGELESQVKQNTVVDTGKTKNSWQHRVTKKGQDYVAAVGSDYENAIWEEFGTGEYALNGDGRKGGWFYVDAKGDGHFTRGKRPRRPFHHAYTTLKDKIIKFLQDQFKGGLS